jgi:uncharacterized protein YoxC
MSPTAAWVLVGLFAVLVAVTVPVLLQLRKTLQAAEKTVETTGQRLDAALGELTTTLTKVNRAAEELERGTQKIAPLFDALHGIADGFVKVRGSLTTVAAVGASIGPMMLAGLRGFFGRDKDEDKNEEKELVEEPKR